MIWIKQNNKRELSNSQNFETFNVTELPLWKFVFLFVLRQLNKLLILSMSAWHFKSSILMQTFFVEINSLQMKLIIFIDNFINAKRYEKPWHYTAVSNIVETSSEWKWRATKLNWNSRSTHKKIVICSWSFNKYNTRTIR